MAIDRRQILKATLATPLLASSCGSSIPSEEASDPIDGLVSMTVDLDPIPQSEYDARLERLWKKLQEEKVEAFVAEAGPTLEYFTGASWWRSERIFAAVIGVDRPPIFACKRGILLWSSARPTPFNSVSTCCKRVINDASGRRQPRPTVVRIAWRREATVPRCGCQRPTSR